MLASTTPVPAGCVIALLGLFAWAHAGYCAYSIWRTMNPESPAEEVEFPKDFAIAGAVSFVGGSVLVVGGWRNAVAQPQLTWG